MIELTSLDSLVLIGIRVYVSRQAVILQALHQLRPALMAIMGLHPLISSSDDKEIHQLIQLQNQIPSQGVWGDNREWSYFLHGVGCKLVHNQTGEPIEWDLPDLKVFDRWWFRNWLNWRYADSELFNNIRSQSVVQMTTLDEMIFQSLDRLRWQKYISDASGKGTNKFILASG